MKCPSCHKKPMDQTDTAFICTCGATVRLTQWAVVHGLGAAAKPGAGRVSTNARNVARKEKRVANPLYLGFTDGPLESSPLEVA